MILVDWPPRHRLVVEGQWRGVVRFRSGELRARVRLARRLALPPPSRAVLEPGAVLAVEWDAALSDALRQVSLGRGDTLDGMMITIESDGAGAFTVRAREVTVAAPTLAPAARLGPTVTPAGHHVCIAGCGVWLPRGAPEYCSNRCCREARARRRGAPLVAAPSSA